MLSEIKRLLKVTGNGFRFIILLVLRSPVDICLTVIHAIFLQHAFNAIEQNDVRRLTAVCFTFIIAGVCIFMYNGIIWSIYSSFVVQMESKLRVYLLDKITKFSYERIEATTHNELLTRLNTDVQMPFSKPIHFPHAVNAILRIGVSAVILWSISPEVFLWTILFVVPHIITSQLLVARVMPRLNKKHLEAMANNTGDLAVFITTADIALLYDGKDYLIRRFEKSSLELLQAKIKILRRNALNAAIAILPFGLSGYLTLLIASSRWIANGSLTFGDLSAAFQYRLGLLMGSMMLINSIISIQASMAGIRRINETMYEKTEDTNER